MTEIRARGGMQAGNEVGQGVGGEGQREALGGDGAADVPMHPNGPQRRAASAHERLQALLLSQQEGGGVFSGGTRRDGWEWLAVCLADLLRSELDHATTTPPAVAPTTTAAATAAVSDGATAAAASATAGCAQAARSRAERAASLMREGAQSNSRGAYAVAVRHFEHSFALKPKGSTLISLANMLVKCNAPLPAAAIYAAAIDSEVPLLSVAECKVATRKRADVEAQLAAQRQAMDAEIARAAAVAAAQGEADLALRGCAVAM